MHFYGMGLAKIYCMFKSQLIREKKKKKKKKKKKILPLHVDTSFDNRRKQANPSIYPE